ncbi:MAG: hypothetical protein HON80_09840 [Marinovum sp.]|jgi:aminomethyltransferase|nr:hypothetical protein [Marinovum sp.]
MSTSLIGQGGYVPICDCDGWLINDPVVLKFTTGKLWLRSAIGNIEL